MDSYRATLPTDALPDADAAQGHGAAADDDIGHQPPPIRVGQDERRMQVRAYNHWTGLLGPRNLPRIEDLAAARAPDFSDHAFVLNFAEGMDNPAVTMLGHKLAMECGSAKPIERLSDVPASSLLCRITDHYRQILTNHAPLGFEAEFINHRGKTVVYRGILLPFSSDGEHIQQVMGVINWKELASAGVTAQLHAELLGAADGYGPPPAAPLGEWADGPLAAGDMDAFGLALSGSDLTEMLASARDQARNAASLEDRSRAALYAAIGQAWNFALAAEPVPELFSTMLAEAGLHMQARAPMTALARLIFGADYDKTRLSEFATVLVHARRQGVEYDGLAAYLAQMPGGVKSVVAEERALRRMAGKRAA